MTIMMLMKIKMMYITMITMMRMVTMMAIMNYNRPIWSKSNLVMMLRLINLLQKQHRKKRFDIKGMLEGRKKKWICWRSDSLSIKQANGEQRKKKLMGRGERCQLCGLRDKLDISKRTWKKTLWNILKCCPSLKKLTSLDQGLTPIMDDYTV